MANPQKKVSLSETVFPVIEVPAIYRRDNKQLKQQTGHKFIVREDTNEVISCMTNEYKLVTNEKVLQEVMPTMKKNKAVFKESQIFSDGARTKWTWYFPNIQVEIAKNDVVNPEITVQNSYDGSWELSFTAGAFRLVCSNGLTIGTIISMKKNRHSIYNTNLYKISDMIAETVEKCNGVFTEDFQKLINTPLKKKSVIKVIQTLPQQAIDPFVAYTGRNDMKSYWDLLNAFTWVTTHALNRRHESTHKLENKVYPLIRSMAQA